MNPDHDKLVKLMTDHWQDSADGLDAATRSKLNRIRQAAIEGRQARSWSLMNWLPVAAAATLAVAVILLVSRPDSGLIDDQSGLAQQDAINATEPFISDDASSALEDLELLASAESIELYEDLEFYQWLESELAESGTL